MVPDIGIIGILFFGSLEAFHRHWALRATHTAVPRDIQHGIRSVRRSVRTVLALKVLVAAKELLGDGRVLVSIV